MRWSITTRILVAVNAMALAVGLATGWISMHLLSRAAENRLLREPVGNAVRLIAALRLPCSDRLARELQEMTSCETAFLTEGLADVLASSLPPARRGRLCQTVAAGPIPSRLTLDGQGYVVATETIPGTTPPVRLVLLMPVEVLQAVTRRGTWRIIWVTLAAVVATTALGAGIAHNLTRSLRGLAQDAARMTAALEAGRAAAADPGTDPADSGQELRFEAAGAPAEVASLAASFNQVLDRLAATRRDLEHAAQLAAVGRLAASVVHELRNPLCGIQMNARVLADAAAQRGDRDPSLDLIVREVGRIDLFLHELLLLSGKPAPLAASPGTAPATADLQAAVASVLTLVSGRARHAGVTTTDATGSCPALTLGIGEVPLRQVLLNLAFNALDAMPDGGALTVDATRLEGGGARVEVRDTGRGVQTRPDEDVFAPFVSHRPGGSGLGLYVCRQIVERHHGRIGCMNNPGGGATFWFELPGAAAPPVSGRPAGDRI